MSQTGQPHSMLELIDAALERFASRELIASAEIVDVLLDLRSVAPGRDPLEELLDAERVGT